MIIQTIDHQIMLMSFAIASDQLADILIDVVIIILGGVCVLNF